MGTADTPLGGVAYPMWKGEHTGADRAPTMPTEAEFAMVKKRCKMCRKTSYSLSEKGYWICPHCAADITDQPVIRPAACVDGIVPIAPLKDDPAVWN